jgi:uncharacterized membrane protein
MKTKQTIHTLILTSIFVSIVIILSFSPFGYVQYGIVKATTIHIPVIIASIILGPKIGSTLGFVFGISSLIVNTMLPTVLSFVFSPLIPLPGESHGSWFSLIICFVPRILTGIVPYYVYIIFKKIFGKNTRTAWISILIAAVSGSLVNTLLVLNLMYLFYQKQYALAKNISSDAIYITLMSIVSINGIPEALIAGMIVTSSVKILERTYKLTTPFNG